MLLFRSLNSNRAGHDAVRAALACRLIALGASDVLSGPVVKWYILCLGDTRGKGVVRSIARNRAKCLREQETVPSCHHSVLLRCNRSECCTVTRNCYAAGCSEFPRTATRIR